MSESTWKITSSKFHFLFLCTIMMKLWNLWIRFYGKIFRDKDFVHRKMAYFSSLVRKPFSFILCKGACTWFQITWFSELAENIKIDISKHYIPESSKGCPNIILLMSFHNSGTLCVSAKWLTKRGLWKSCHWPWSSFSSKTFNSSLPVFKFRFLHFTYLTHPEFA